MYADQPILPFNLPTFRIQEHNLPTTARTMFVVHFYRPVLLVSILAGTFFVVFPLADIGQPLLRRSPHSLPGVAAAEARARTVANSQGHRRARGRGSRLVRLTFR